MALFFMQNQEIIFSHRWEFGRVSGSGHKGSFCWPKGTEQCELSFNKTDKTMSIQCVLLSFYQRVFGNLSKQDKI